MKALVIICYFLPSVVVWLLWAALVFWAGVPEWFGSIVKYGAIAQTAIAAFMLTIILK